MNCPSRTDEPLKDQGWNQSPSALSADLTTRQDLNGIVNKRTNQDSATEADDARSEPQTDAATSLPLRSSATEGRNNKHSQNARLHNLNNLIQRFSLFKRTRKFPVQGYQQPIAPEGDFLPPDTRSPASHQEAARPFFKNVFAILKKFFGFVGPGFLVAVAYIDPGNYSTDVSAGAAKRFSLLFIVLMSNIFAVILQSLAIRLGTVTGLNLAEHCRAHLPRWLNIFLYILGEGAIIATDIAEVIGSAIALNLLIPQIPLVAGCAITVVDVLVILIFWSPNGSLRRLRMFEFFVVTLVLGVVICFCIELAYIHKHRRIPVGQVFKGYLPSSAVVDGQGLYLSCGILGATVMPHSLYLGSGMVQPRLRDFDMKAGNSVPGISDGRKGIYRPSLAAIKSCMSYSIAEVIFSLCLFALLVNSAILIVAGASLNQNSEADEGDLFVIHGLLAKTLAPAAGILFALALLLSGTSAGIVCTIAGQILCEGALDWKISPWLRRFITRSISIIPSIIIAGAIGSKGLSKALNGTQVALSVALPFVSAPLIYFTCRDKYMRVGGAKLTRARQSLDGRIDMRVRGSLDGQVEMEPDLGVGVKMRNHWIVSGFAIIIWLVITVMNIALLVLLGLGKA